MTDFQSVLDVYEILCSLATEPRLGVDRLPAHLDPGDVAHEALLRILRSVPMQVVETAGDDGEEAVVEMVLRRPVNRTFLWRQIEWCVTDHLRRQRQVGEEPVPEVAVDGAIPDPDSAELLANLLRDLRTEVCGTAIDRAAWSVAVGHQKSATALLPFDDVDRARFDERVYRVRQKLRSRILDLGLHRFERGKGAEG